MPQNIKRCLPPTVHIQLELDHTAFWHSQGSTAKVKPLDNYRTVEDIFKELSRQSKTKIAIPVGTKEINQTIVEPLTNQEKEEYYEVHLHISTFTSEDSPTEEKNSLHIVKVMITQ